MPGFVQDKLTIKLVLLYILDLLDHPVDFATMNALALCDEGIDYFQFAECLNDLVETSHVLLQDDLYSITEKGRKNCEICESSIPYTVRLRCEANAAEVNEAFRKASCLKAETVESEPGIWLARLYYKNDADETLALSLSVPDQAAGGKLCARFQKDPAGICAAIRALLHE